MNEDGEQTFLAFFAPPPGVPLASAPVPSTGRQAPVIGVGVPPTASPANDPPRGTAPDLPRDEATRGHDAREIRRPGNTVFERSARARHYRLTLRRDGTAVVTIPVRGSERGGLRFLDQHREWLERARERQRHRPRTAEVWTVGTHVLWRGELREIRAASFGAPTAGGQPDRPKICLAADVFRVANLEGDLRPTLEAHFVRRAKIELTARAWELAAITGVEVKHVTVRNQRSRWGSCSANGTISLNWRLVQTPEFVRDYIIYHELMHLREMNHSARFWARVEEVCPDWRSAERWIKRNGSLVGL